MNFKTDHEVRGITEIVSAGRPQRRARRNRIARATMADCKILDVAAVRDAAESTEAEALGSSINTSGVTCRETTPILSICCCHGVAAVRSADSNAERSVTAGETASSNS